MEGTEGGGPPTHPAIDLKAMEPSLSTAQRPPAPSAGAESTGEESLPLLPSASPPQPVSAGSNASSSDPPAASPAIASEPARSPPTAFNFLLPGGGAADASSGSEQQADSNEPGSPASERRRNGRHSPNNQGLMLLQDTAAGPAQRGQANQAARAASAHQRHTSVHSYGSRQGFESPSQDRTGHDSSTAVTPAAGNGSHVRNHSLSQIQLPLQPAVSPPQPTVNFSPPVTKALLASSPVLISPGDDPQDLPPPTQYHRPSRHESNMPLLQGLHHHDQHHSAQHSQHSQHSSIVPMEIESTHAGSAAATSAAALSASPSAGSSLPRSPATGSTYDQQPGTGGDTPESQIRSPRTGRLHPKYPPVRRKICGCIPWSRDPNRRLSFVTIMVFLVVVQVVVSCVLVWLLGYLSTQSTVAVLTRTIRSSLMHDVSFELNQAMKEPLQAAYDIENLLTLRYPDLENRTSISQTSGWMADVCYVAMRYPAVSRVGFATRKNVYVLITKGISSSGVAEPLFSSDNNQTVTVAEESSGSNTVTLLNYRPTRIHLAVSSPPFALRPEIDTDDTPSDIARYLGAPFGPVYNFSVTNRPFYKAAEDVLSQGLLTGWSNVYSSNNPQTAGSSFLAIAAVNAHVASDGSGLGFVSFAVTNLDNLNRLLQELPLGPSGMGFFIRTNGRVVSSSVPSINDEIRRSVGTPTGAAGQLDLDMFTSGDPWLQKLAPVLLDWNLITTEAITPRNSSQIIPYRTDVYERSVSYRGDTYHIQAAMISNLTSGLPLTSVIVTKDSDFDGNVRENNRNTIILSVVVALLAVVLSYLVTRCVARPMMVVVEFMERACTIIEMERSAKQREELSALCEEWSDSSGMVLPPLLTSSAFVSMAIKTQPARLRSKCSCQVGKDLRENQAMSKAFGSMLYSLASYDELEAINHAKRAFIRYIFHEVRVPFNAIVLGIEQMESELREQPQPMVGALDTLGIISEQSQVVSRILNDVLSMQKIEDGALTLEYDVFSMEKMIRGSLYAFRSPCMDKRIKVKVSLTNIDELVARALPAFKIGQVINQGAAGGGEHGRIGSGGGNVSDNDEDETGASRKHFRARHQYMHRAYVRGDPYRLRQVFSNLLTNAVKFSPHAGRIQVTMEAYDFRVSPYAAAANASLLLNDGKYSLYPQPSPPSTPATVDGMAAHAQGVGAQSHVAPSTSVDTNTSMPSTPNLGPSHTNLPPGASAATTIPAAPMALPEILGTMSVRVAVRDSGPGVPPAEAAHLFSAYMQVSAGKTQKGNGTGLGLSISKSIVELHGGQIGFNSIEKPPEPMRSESSIMRRVRGGSGKPVHAPATGAEFFFIIPLDVSLVKSRSSNQSSNGSMGSITFQSGGGSSGAATAARDSSSDPTVKLETITGSPNTASGPQRVNWRDEDGNQSSLLLHHHPASVRGRSPDDDDRAALSPHVGLVHRTHPLESQHERKDSEPSSRSITRSNPNSPANRIRHDNELMRHARNVSRSQGKLLSPGGSNKHQGGSGGGDGSHERMDSVVDIAPLAEAGIGLHDPDSQRISGDEVSISRIHFHEQDDEMDPTRGDWDHIERGKEEPRTAAAATAAASSNVQPVPLPSVTSPVRQQSMGSATKPPSHPRSQPTRGTASGVPIYLDTPLNGTAAAGSSGSGSSSTASAATPAAGQSQKRPMPAKLAIATISAGSSTTTTSSSSSSSSSGAHRATHAIDLASFISEETKEKSRRMQQQQQQQHGSSGWTTGSQVNLSPDSAPSGDGSNPSTPFMSASGSDLPRSSLAGKAPTYRNSCRVLVVEDSLPNRKLLVSLLGRLKCVAQGVEDGQQCVDLFKPFMEEGTTNNDAAIAARERAISEGKPIGNDAQQYPFDIILMVRRMRRLLRRCSGPPVLLADVSTLFLSFCVCQDGTMPVMNGVVATQILRSHGINLPIVAVTGNALSEVRRRRRTNRLSAARSLVASSRCVACCLCDPLFRT